MSEKCKKNFTISAGTFVIVLLWLCLFVAGKAFCDEVSDDYKRQFDFAESLYREEDYFRAITEYKRFIFYHPGRPELCERAAFMICSSYFKAKRWEESIESCKRFIRSYPESRSMCETHFMEARSETQLGLYDDALSTYQKTLQLNSNESIRERALFESAAVYIKKKDWNAAKKIFSSFSRESVYYRASTIFSEGLDHLNRIPQKSPAVAGVLAAVLPGAGHLYTERPRDALVAFLLNGAFILAAVELFEDDNFVAGGVVTFFELGWYSGNIYSAVSSAHKYNDKKKRDFIQGLIEKSGMRYHIDTATKGHYLLYAFRF